MTYLAICTPLGRLNQVDSEVDRASSYGLIAHELQAGIASQGVQSVLITRESPMPAEGPPSAVLFLGTPIYYNRFPSWVQNVRPRMALTMFESTRLPLGWADVLNSMDTVLTPTRWGRALFWDNGVTAPIVVAPLGICPVYTPVKRSPNSPLTFLSFLDRGIRKGGLTALSSFVKTFGKDPDVRLILKGRASRVPFSVDHANVTVIQEDYTEQQMAVLYHSAHILFFPSRGEGFGLPPREFAATGGLSLATQWSGTGEDLDLWGVGIDYNLVPATFSNPEWRGQDLGQWAEPKTDCMIWRLSHASQHADRYLRDAADKANAVREKYQWGDLSRSVWWTWQVLAH